MVKRELYLNQIVPLIDNELIKVITGIRRCGKSYMLGLIIDELLGRGISRDNIFLINFEMAKYRNVRNSRELDLLIESLVKDVEGKVYLFFDEIQNVDGWELSINACRVDWDSDIYVTGSNSKLLSGEFASHLTGRYFEIKMYPFSYKEFLDYKGVNSSDAYFKEYLEYGGFPQIFNLSPEDKLKNLNDLFNSIIYNDILSRFNVRNVGLFERLVIFLMDNMGKVFSANSICDYLKDEVRIEVAPNTIYNYINYLSYSRLINKVQREDVEGKEIIKLFEKYYVTDHGFNQVFNGRNVTNISRTIENIVYVELLRRGFAVTIGKVGDYEVDFVAKKNKQRIYVQVSYLLSSEKTVKREFGSLLKIRDNYPKYVISMDQFDFSREGIIHLNLIDFLLMDYDVNFF